MLAAIKRFKDHLSHVDPRSWHFQVVNIIWEKRDLLNTKACTYYWLKLPIALVWAGIVCVLAGLFYSVGWFFGFQPVEATFNRTLREESFYRSDTYLPYKTDHNGDKKRIAPWEVVISFIVLFVLAYHVLAYSSTFFWLVILAIKVFGGLAALVGIGYFVRKNWDNVCPTLVILDKPNQEVPANH